MGTGIPDQAEILQSPEEFDSPYRKYYGIYRGEVRDVNDPEKMARARVFIHGVHPDQMPDNLLPWAEWQALAGGGPDFASWLSFTERSLKGISTLTPEFVNSGT